MFVKICNFNEPIKFKKTYKYEIFIQGKYVMKQKNKSENIRLLYKY